MKKLREALRGQLPDLVLVLGAAVLTAGVGMIYLPAGLIVGGGLLMAGAILNGGDAP